MQYRSPAFQAARGEKSADLDRSTEGYRLQPAGTFAQGQNSDLHFHLPFPAAFNLQRLVLQPPFTDRHAGRGVAQGLAFDQQAGKLEAVQPVVPVPIR